MSGLQHRCGPVAVAVGQLDVTPALQEVDMTDAERCTAIDELRRQLRYLEAGVEPSKIPKAPK